MQERRAMLVGASKGLGFAITEELLRRGWHVTATIRSGDLHQLQSLYKSRLTLERVDTVKSDSVKELRQRLDSQAFDLVFVNAGIGSKNGMSETISSSDADDFSQVMLTNAFAPVQFLEEFSDLVVRGGVFGAMSSGQGSIADAESGSNDIYRASKAALNMLMKSFSVRHKDHATLLLAPGWVQTEMGGANAKFTIADVIPDLVNTIEAQLGQSGLHYVDRFNKSLSW